MFSPMTHTPQGHAIHFLERQIRASEESYSLSIELYHRPNILRWVLSRVRIPDECERVAISLDSEDKGPFLVATREGAFVTCLGRDMTTTGLHLVPYGQFMAHRDDWHESQRRLAVCDEISKPNQEHHQFLQETLHRGIYVSREEFIAASALQIVLKNQMGLLLLTWGEKTMTLFRRLGRRQNPSRAGDEVLREFWESHWSLGHLALLASMDGERDLVESLRPILCEILLDLFHWGELSLCIRALWSLGRLGRIAFKACRQRLETPTDSQDWLGAALGIALIGLRNKKYTTTANRLLSSTKSLQGRNGSAPPYFHEWGSTVLDRVREVIADPVAADALQVGVFKGNTFQFARELELGPPFDFADADAVPDDFSRAVLVCWEHDLRGENACIDTFIRSLPWLSRCEAADLYPPQAWVDSVRAHTEWTRQASLALIERNVAFFGKDEPYVAPALPGRNDPCPCKSGKKYKKCCGAPK